MTNSRETRIYRGRGTQIPLVSSSPLKALFELKNEDLKKKWIRARGRVKTSVKLNLSAKAVTNRKHDLLVEEEGGIITVHMRNICFIRTGNGGSGGTL